MPRSNRRRRDLESRPLGGATEVSTQQWRGRRFHVRRLTGVGATREYRCPGCHQEVLVGTPHVVVWPAEGIGGIAERRHWHARCWSARDAVGP
ncbi:MAG: hypothetical protein ACRCXL_04205 [Dermatophilaceae bacterium]